MKPKVHGLDYGYVTQRPLATRLRIIQGLQTIWHDTELYKQLLSTRGSSAQALLDTLQTLLDDPTIEENRRNLVVATERLSKATNLYPHGFELEGVRLLNGDPEAGGGFSDIYKGNFQGRMVCLKVIRIHEPLQVQHIQKQYSREAIIWRQLTHPNLLPFIEYGHVTNYLEHFEPRANRLLLVIDVAAGTQYLHENTTIHGDLKGANILVNESARACVADFGLSSVNDSQILQWTSQSSAASKGGTLRWQAPEIHNSSNDEIVHNTTASDVYAWAGVCYEIFTGRIPFHDYNYDAAVLVAVAAGKRPTPPPAFSQPWTDWGLTQSLWNIMQECWRHDPAARPTIPNIISRISSGIVDDRLPASWSDTVFRPRGLNPRQDNRALSVIEGIISSCHPNVSPNLRELQDDHPPSNAPVVSNQTYSAHWHMSTKWRLAIFGFVVSLIVVIITVGVTVSHAYLG